MKSYPSTAWLNHLQEAQNRVANIWATTQGEVLKFTHSWTIPNFRSHQNRQCIVGAPFSSGKKDGTVWRLAIHPNVGVHRQDHVSIELLLKSTSRSDISAAWTFSILNLDNIPIRTIGIDEPVEFKPGESWTIDRAIRRDILAKHWKRASDPLTVKCEITVLVGHWSPPCRGSALSEPADCIITPAAARDLIKAPLIHASQLGASATALPVELISLPELQGPNKVSTLEPRNADNEQTLEQPEEEPEPPPPRPDEASREKMIADVEAELAATLEAFQATGEVTTGSGSSHEDESKSPIVVEEQNPLDTLSLVSEEFNNIPSDFEEFFGVASAQATAFGLESEFHLSEDSEDAGGTSGIGHQENHE